ncbi:hypothetical protein [Corallococcus aberystwythensis]|uniref:hypothetical protein n=1 Tax=Corallococcus aberystwythensis TaxID=2316722 RepID=UPI0011C37749|nr:hypothetical protein [Corallococcus aberystwythensis]
MSLERVTDGRSLELDGIRFSEVAFVRIGIDGEELQSRPQFSDALVVFDELEKSATGSGRYLIFTCACGIAEDGGWEGVEVDLDDSTVRWTLEVASEPIRFVFDRALYVSEINGLRRQLAHEALPLAPRGVVFPEGFRRS